MIHGLDTTFLVQVEVAEHPDHAAARATIERLLERSDTFALAPQVVTEFAHVVTDGRRFSRPLTMDAALARAAWWTEAREIAVISPGEEAVRLCLGWMRQQRLGRKRLLDTLLAATYFGAGITSILTTNARDYQTFGCFQVIAP